MTGEVAKFTVDSISSSLLNRVRANDSDAWSHLSQVYGPLVYRWARIKRLQEDDAADIVQEVFRAVAKSIHTFDQEGGTRFRSWLWGVTRNKLRDHFRRLGSRPQATGGTDAHLQMEQIPESAPTDGETSDGFDPEASLMHRVLEIIRIEFEDRTWKAFWQAAVDGEASSDIAESLGMSRQAVRQAKYRVLRRLREEMGDLACK